MNFDVSLDNRKRVGDQFKDGDVLEIDDLIREKGKV